MRFSNQSAASTTGANIILEIIISGASIWGKLFMQFLCFSKKIIITSIS